MSFYMMEIPLENQPVLVIGGGEVAKRKIEGVLQAKANITVLAPKLDPVVTEWVKAGKIAYRAGPFSSDCLTDSPRPLLVFAATNHAELNKHIGYECRMLGLLCNSADDPASSGFLVPAVVRRGPLTVAIGTQGSSPALARVIKMRLERWLEPGWGELAQLFGELRSLIYTKLPDPIQRRRFWQQASAAAETEERFNKTENRAWLLARLNLLINNNE
ncbi:MAG: bifunctional precorrin-2 dehydrogenase/sirohydrochlorin ferrochelatase [Magnetococcus sp. DMHC-6]